MEKTSFFYDFYGFGGIRSTRGPHSDQRMGGSHPLLGREVPIANSVWGLRCAEAVFLKLTLMVQLETVLTTFGFDRQRGSLAIELR